MRKVILYVGMSLDGHLADKDGNVDWMQDQADLDVGNQSYKNFIKSLDTVVMGHTTYDQITQQLSPDAWPYTGLKSYVLTHRSLGEVEDIAFVNESVSQLIERLKHQPGKNIWICGGADVISQCIAEDLIDEYDLTIIPTLLGGGIRLFPDSFDRLPLTLVKTEDQGGMVRLVYTRRD